MNKRLRRGFSVAEVPPLTPQAVRPFWSVMITVFNRREYLAEAIQSVLDQDPGPDQMQIEVVDDHSTAFDVEALVKEVGKGRVGYFRQPRRVGLFSNWDTCIQRSQGQWLHQLHDDDLVLPGFYERMQSAIEQAPEIGMAFCRSRRINAAGEVVELSSFVQESAGVVPEMVQKLAQASLMDIAAVLVRRDIFEQVGGLRQDLPYVADWELWLRVSAAQPVWFEPEPLACYRVHSNSATSSLARSGEVLSDIRRACAVARDYLPADVSRRNEDQVLAYASQTAITAARDRWREGEAMLAVRLTLEAVRCCSSLSLLAALMRRVARGLGVYWRCGG